MSRSISSLQPELHSRNMNLQYDECLANSLVSTPRDLLSLAASTGQLIGGVLGAQSSHLTLERCEPPIDSNSVHNYQYSPNYEKCEGYSTTFEDPFPFQQVGDFPTPLKDEKSKPKESKSSSATDNKLLGFSGPILRAAVFDDSGQTWPIMSAELYGMFFVAEDVFGESTARGDELTCYRRNLFQISGAMILSRGMNGIINEQGQHIPIYNLEATLTAFESIEGKNVEIISVPWKSANCTTSGDRAGSAPSSLPLDLNMNPELDPSNASIPISWKRLQFKHATANNGRRKGLQQHYIVQVNLVATLGNGEIFKLAEIQSGPIIVRGRSPRNFDSRNKDNEKKYDAKVNQSNEPTTPTHKVDNETGLNNYTFANSTDCMQSCSDASNCKYNHEYSPDDSHPAKKRMLSLSTCSPIIYPNISNSAWTLDSPIGSRFSGSSPIDTSQLEEEINHAQNLSHNNSLRKGLSRSPVIQKSKRGLSFNSMIENADFLYEYFPLTVDDWIPPVDAIYRPHVVHHTATPEIARAEQNSNKRKTYFSAID
ncbi:Protein pacG [Erysiphe neolycopersici]|uniref:Protein pacG n=1 Tax=Erysiphe neolycopersici TaxID=212602 RepID=A0A420HML6_9PEZI|nr:Protein pacG [Erysiphe neolycopersici]